MLAALAIFVLTHWVDIPALQEYVPIGVGFIQCVAAIQILKSSTRSVCLPLLAVVIGAVLSQQVTGGEQLLYMSHQAFSVLTLVGIVGLAFSILAID